MTNAPIPVSAGQARRFVLHRQGLLGAMRFRGPGGIMDYIRSAGCLQFDPVNVCGRSPELALLCRVEGYRPQMLEGLLYGSRELVEHFDKNLCYFPARDWPYLRRNRLRMEAGHRAGSNRAAMEAVLEEIREKGPMGSADLGLKGKVDWHWGPTTLGRAALEQLYFEGRLLVHRRQGIVRTYDLAERCLPPDVLHAPEPFSDDLDHHCFRVLRRIGAVGMLWNRASDAWLGIPGMKAPQRQAAFARLAERGDVLGVRVEGVADTLYIRKEDEPDLAAARDAEGPVRCSLLPPLDCLLWDRRLVRALFGFQYTWEIYTPPEKRLYGPYVLPILLGERFAGRVEPVCDRKKGLLTVRGLWWEEGFGNDPAARRALEEALASLAAFNGCRLQA
ncbi:MAG TPA: crosslink repair DNA glycosylase YcaQ family protein [Candidatus Limnocylindria bacterium]|nr:crosslink repair DNA glycosylase YcaQ family protein [Candidatus Limnocylindria bacterium]